MKKIFAFVIALAMVLSLVTVPAMAETKAPVDPRTVSTVPAEPRDAATVDEALNIPGGTLVFTNDSTYPWVVDGDAAKSGNAGISSSTSAISTTVTAAAGDVLQFDFKAWGEGSSTFWDHCDCYVDSTRVLYYGAHDNADWETLTVELEAGEHTITWSYTKDSSVNPTGDYFMVDNVYVGVPASVESISVEPVEVGVGLTTTVSYEVLPANAADKSVTFEIGNEEVATVDENGVITGVAEGTTIVIVTSVADPSISGNATVHVVPGPESVDLFGLATYDIGSTYTGQWVEFMSMQPGTVTGHGALGATSYAAAFAGGNVYGFYYDSNTTNGNYFIMDAETYAVSEIENPATVLAMAYNYATNQMYAITNGNSDRAIATVDLATGTVTTIADITGMENTAMTLAINGEGVAYTLSYGNPSNLYTLNLETGEATLVGSTGVNLAYVQSMTFDIETNQLFWAQISTTSDSALYLVDPETAECHNLGRIGSSGMEITNLYTKNDIEIGPIDTPDVTITFVDGVDNSVIDTYVMQGGQVIPEEAFPEPPVHEGLEFVEWDYNGAAVYQDITVTARYFDPNAIIWDFETDPAEQGFQMIDQDGDGYNWEWQLLSSIPAEPRYHEGLGYIDSASYINDFGALTPDNWLITPAFEGGGSLKFWARGQDPSYAAEYLGIFVSTDNGETWSEEITNFTLTGTDTQYTVDLSDYATRGEILLAIRHYNITDMFIANLDYIEVSVPQGNPDETPVPETPTPEPETPAPETPVPETPEPGTLDDALNVEGGTLHFESEGTYPWIVVTEGDRVFAQSSNGGNASTESVLTLNVELEESQSIYFDFKAWGEGSSTFWDHCDFAIDGEVQFTYGAYDNEWELYTCIIPAGAHTLTWSYTKDSSVNPTGDYFAIDNVSIGEAPDVTVTFVDGLTSETIGELVVPAGTVLAEEDFPEAPEHEGYVFTGWNYNGEPITVDTTITANYQDPNSTIWDFETDPNEQGFQFLDQDGDGNNWEWRYGEEWAEFNYHEGLGYMMSASYINYVGALTPDNWMITPAFQGSSLTFWAQGQDPSYAEEYIGVYVSTDDGATWSEELLGVTLTGDDTQYTVDLSAYTGTLRVAIRHYNVTDMFQANVDYIEVHGSGEVSELIGDVDLDGDVDIADAILTLRFCMGLIDLGDQSLINADVNFNDYVSIDDAIMILRAAMGLITLG